MAQNTIANAWVQLMPSFQGGQAAIQRELGGPLDAAGRDGGRRFGTGMTAGIAGLATKMFAPLAAAAASVSLVGIFKDSIDQASGLQEAGTKLNAIFGEDGAAAVQKFADTGAKALGQNKLAVLDSVATFGTMGKAAGLSGEDLAKFGNGFATLSTDLASFYNTSPEEAVEAIGSALRGEAEPIRKYGVLLDDASLKAEAMKQGLISTTKDALTPQQKVLAAQGLIMAQTADAQGDFERTSGGLANQQRILSASFTDLKGVIGNALLPVVTRITTAVGGFVSGMIDGTGAGGAFIGFLKGIWNALKPVGEFITNVVVVAFGKLREALGIFTGGFKFGGMNEFEGGLRVVNNAGVILGDFFRNTLIPALQRFGDFVTGTVVPALSRLGEFIQTTVLPALLRFGAFIAANVVPALQKVGAFIITSIVPAVVSMAQTIAANVMPILQALWTQFQTNILPVLQKVFTIITGQVVPVLVRLGQAIVPVISFIVKLVAQFLGFLIPAIVNFAGPIIGFLINAIGNVIGWVAQFIGFLIDLGKNVQTFVRAGVAKFMEFKDRAILAFLTLKGQVTVIIAAVKNFIQDRIADIVGMALKIIAFKDKVVAGFTAMRDEAITRIVGLVSEVKALPGKIVAAIGNLADTFKQKGKDLIQGLIDGINDKVKAVKDTISNIASTIGDFLPGSPVKQGPLRKWNNGMAGKRLVGMLADGLNERGPIESAMRGLTRSIATPSVAGLAAGGGVGAAGAGVTINAYGAREDVLAAEVVKKQRQHDALMFAGV